MPPQSSMMERHVPPQDVLGKDAAGRDSFWQPGRVAAAPGGVSQAYNPASGTFHALEGGGPVPDADATSVNGSEESAEDPSQAGRGLKAVNQEKREKVRAKNERKHQRQKEKRAQELRERCTAVLTARKLECCAQNLVSMGFPKEKAITALVEKEGNMEAAIAWLLEEANEEPLGIRSRTNIKIDIADELARLAALEFSYNYPRADIERAIVASDGDIEAAAMSLRERFPGMAAASQVPDLPPPGTSTRGPGPVAPEAQAVNHQPQPVRKLAPPTPEKDIQPLQWHRQPPQQAAPPPVQMQGSPGTVRWAGPVPQQMPAGLAAGMPPVVGGPRGLPARPVAANPQTWKDTERAAVVAALKGAPLQQQSAIRTNGVLNRHVPPHQPTQAQAQRSLHGHLPPASPPTGNQFSFYPQQAQQPKLHKPQPQPGPLPPQPGSGAAPLHPQGLPTASLPAHQGLFPPLQPPPPAAHPQAPGLARAHAPPAHMHTHTHGQGHGHGHQAPHGMHGMPGQAQAPGTPPLPRLGSSGASSPPHSYHGSPSLSPSSWSGVQGAFSPSSVLLAQHQAGEATLAPAAQTTGTAPIVAGVAPPATQTLAKQAGASGWVSGWGSTLTASRIDWSMTVGTRDSEAPGSSAGLWGGNGTMGDPWSISNGLATLALDQPAAPVSSQPEGMGSYNLWANPINRSLPIGGVGLPSADLKSGDVADWVSPLGDHFVPSSLGLSK